MLELVITFFVGIISGILSGIVGGGSGLISAPFFILLGLPPVIAVATTKFGAVGLTLGSLLKFRGTEHIRREYIILLSVLSVVAAAIGSHLLIASSDRTIEKLVGILMLAALPLLFIKNVGLTRSEPHFFKKLTGYVLFLLILILQAAFGGGIGMMLMIVMTTLMGFTVLEANATRRVPGFLLAATALIIYMLNGIVYYSYGLAMFGGMVVGGYLGSHIAVKRGNAFVKVAFAIIVAVLGINLLMN